MAYRNSKQPKENPNQFISNTEKNDIIEARQALQQLRQKMNVSSQEPQDPIAKKTRPEVVQKAKPEPASYNVDSYVKVGEQKGYQVPQKKGTLQQHDQHHPSQKYGSRPETAQQSSQFTTNQQSTSTIRKVQNSRNQEPQTVNQPRPVSGVPAVQNKRGSYSNQFQSNNNKLAETEEISQKQAVKPNQLQEKPSKTTFQSDRIQKTTQNAGIQDSKVLRGYDEHHSRPQTNHLQEKPLKSHQNSQFQDEKPTKSGAQTRDDRALKATTGNQFPNERPIKSIQQNQMNHFQDEKPLNQQQSTHNFEDRSLRSNQTGQNQPARNQKPAQQNQFSDERQIKSSQNNQFQDERPRKSTQNSQFQEEQNLRSNQPNSFQDERPIKSNPGGSLPIDRSVKPVQPTTSIQAQKKGGIRGKNLQQQDLNNEFQQIQTFPCKDCGRSFNEEALKKHQKVCKKVFLQKRKEFDSSAMRQIVDGNGNPVKIDDPYPSKKNKKGSKAPPVPNSRQQPQSKQQEVPLANQNSKIPKWKLQSSEFRKLFGQKTDNQPQTAQDVLFQQQVQEQLQSDLIPCNHCGRKFNENAAKKHIPFCKQKALEQKQKQQTLKKTQKQ